MSRIIRCVAKVGTEYITVGEEYTYIVTNGQVQYCRTTDRAGSFMSYAIFKRALSTGAIVFIDNL